MDLNEIVIFARVVDAQSFTKAARALELPKSTVSRKISELEDRLGARLLYRTTRKLSLTDVGRTYYAHASRIVTELDEATRAVTQMQEAPRGLLRVTTPLNFSYLAPMLTSFLVGFPEVQLEVNSTDRIVDLVEEGYDLGIRAGQLSDSSLITRALGVLRSYAVASPAYLKKHGVPASPGDLAKHDCLVFGAARDRGTWKLVRDAKEASAKLRPRFIVNDFDILLQAALDGVGIAVLPADRCVGPIREKRLKRVLADWSSPPIPLQAIYPSTRLLSPKVKAFIDHLKQVTPAAWAVNA